jgi:WhiB family redox-sensing transcriptional regulator
MDWRHKAACLDEDPELFFPIGNTGPALMQIEEAKAVCRRCDVVDTCLKWAMESGQDAGVWGGMSEDERRALKRRTARARRVPPGHHGATAAASGRQPPCRSALRVVAQLDLDDDLRPTTLARTPVDAPAQLVRDEGLDDLGAQAAA